MRAYRGAVSTTAVVLLSTWSAHAQSVAILGSDTLAATNTSYTTTQLSGLANSSNTVSWGGYTGVSLWSVLGGSDTTTTSGSTKFYGDVMMSP